MIRTGGIAADAGDVQIKSGEFIRFVIVGGLSTGLYFAVLAGALIYMPVTPASVAAYVAAVGFNYLVQRAWTFRSTRAHRSAAPRHLLVHLVGMALNAGILHIFVERLGFPLLPIQAGALVVVTLWSFLFQKFWVYGVPGEK